VADQKMYENIDYSQFRTR